jgi:uncharacterized protein (UPF0248 family)
MLGGRKKEDQGRFGRTSKYRARHVKERCETEAAYRRDLGKLYSTSSYGNASIPVHRILFRVSFTRALCSY